MQFPKPDHGAQHTLGGPLARLRMPEATFMVVAALVIGILAGYGAVGFRLLIRLLQRMAWGDWVYSLDVVRGHSDWWILLVPAIGGALVAPLAYFWPREAKGHGVPEVMETVARSSGVMTAKTVLLRSVASALSISSGGSVGREGPIVQIGAAMGSIFGQWLKVSGRRLRTLVGCGAAAGIAATFNAPIAGPLFAVEIILGDFGVTQFSPIVIASVVSTVVSRHYLGDTPAFVAPKYGMAHPLELVFYLLLGLFAAAVAWAFVRVLYGFEDICDRIPGPSWILTPIGGLIVGAIGITRPEVFGGGYETIEAALRGDLTWMLLAALLGIKIFATAVTVGSGGSGGVFAPSLFVGATAGGLFGTVVTKIAPSITGEPGAYALVGMGAVVAGATHAPITAILIIFELTHDYGLIVPIMGACIIATLTTRWMEQGNIYTMKLLRRGIDISAGKELNVLRSLNVTDVMSDDAVTLLPTAKLAAVIDEASGSNHEYYYLVDAEGIFQGVIGTAEMREVLLQAENLRDLIIADDLARKDIPVITPDINLDDVMRIFGGKNREELPVVQDTVTMTWAGTVSRGHLLEAYNRELMKRDMVSELASDLSTSRNNEVFLGDKHWMREISVPGTFAQKTLGELDVRNRFGVQVVLVRRPSPHKDRETIELVPGPQTRLELGDEIVVVGNHEALARLS
jgi:chloride channel protein, CIC family